MGKQGSVALTTRSIARRDPGDVRRFGALGNDVANDALAAAAAILASKYSRFANGLKFRFVPQAASPYYFGNQTGSNVYAGVMLTVSDHMVEGPGSKFHIVSRPGVVASDIQYCYATPKNLTLGAQTNITFRGVSVDTENASDAVNSNHRGYYMVGVDGLRLLQTRSFSSGARRGTAGNIQNCKNVQILGHFNYKCTQAFNFRFTENVCVVGGVFYDFSECLDFDGTQKRSVVVGNTFESTSRVNQMWDINGQVDGVFVGATCYMLGNIATIQYKDTTPNNFTDYVNVAAVTTMTPSQRVIVGDVAGSAIGSTTATSFTIGGDWAGIPHAGFPATHDVVLHDIQLADVGFIGVPECERLTLSNIYLENVLTPAAYYAVSLTSAAANAAQVEWSNLTVSIQNLVINGAQRGGLRISQCEWASINNVKIFNVNTSGSADFAVQLNGLDTRGSQISVDNLYISSGNVSISGSASSIALWAASTNYVKGHLVNNGGAFYRCLVTGTSAAAGGPTGIAAAVVDGSVSWAHLPEPYSVYWGLNNRLNAGSILVIAGDAHKYTHGRMHCVQLGDFAATGAVVRTLFTATRKCYVVRGWLIASAAIAADATNYRVCSFKSLTAALGTTAISLVTTAPGMAAFVPMDGGFAAGEVGAYLMPGDTVYLELSSGGTGKALSGLSAQLDVLDC